MTDYEDLSSNTIGTVVVTINGVKSSVPAEIKNRNFKEMLDKGYVDEDGTVLVPAGDGK